MSKSITVFIAFFIWFLLPLWGEAQSNVARPPVEVVPVGETVYPDYYWIDLHTLVSWIYSPTQYIIETFNVGSLRHGQIAVKPNSVDVMPEGALSIRNGYAAWMPSRFKMSPREIIVCCLSTRASVDNAHLQRIPLVTGSFDGIAWMSDNTLEAICTQPGDGLAVTRWTLSADYNVRSVLSAPLLGRDHDACKSCVDVLGRTPSGALLVSSEDTEGSGVVRLCEVSLDVNGATATAHVINLKSGYRLMELTIADDGTTLAWLFAVPVVGGIVDAPQDWRFEIWQSANDGSGLRAAVVDPALIAQHRYGATALRWVPGGRSVSIKWGEKLYIYKMP